MLTDLQGHRHPIVSRCLTWKESCRRIEGGLQVCGACWCGGNCIADILKLQHAMISKAATATTPGIKFYGGKVLSLPLAVCNKLEQQWSLPATWLIIWNHRHLSLLAQQDLWFQHHWRLQRYQIQDSHHFGDRQSDSRSLWLCRQWFWCLLSRPMCLFQPPLKLPPARKCWRLPIYFSCRHVSIHEHACSSELAHGLTYIAMNLTSQSACLRDNKSTEQDHNDLAL